MAAASQIKLVFVISCVFVFLQSQFSVAYVLLFFGGLWLCLYFGLALLLAFAGISAGHSLSQKILGIASKNAYVKKRRLLLWLPFLFLMLYGRLMLLPEKPKLPETWPLQGQKNLPSLQYAKATITSVLRPSRYLAEMQMLIPKKHWRKKYSKSPKKRSAPERAVVYLQINDYYLTSGCKLWLNLKKGHFPSRLPQNYFGDYLRNKGAAAIVRLTRKQLYRKNCRKLSIRGQFQNTLGRMLYKSGFSLHERGVAMALLLGKSGYMNREIKKGAVELGILHLFAASGLHMGIFYLWFYWPLSRWKGKRSKTALSLPLLPCFVYMFLLDFPLSLMRAFCFLSFHALQSFVHRKISTHDLLLNSAICILFVQPQSFLGIGSALSFGAVSGILYFYPLCQKEASRCKFPPVKYVLQQGALSTCAGLFTMPVLLYAFGAYSYSSIIANILLVPFVGLLMPLLIGGISLAIISDGTLLFASKAAKALTEYFIELSTWLKQFSYYAHYDSLLSYPLLMNSILLLCLGSMYRYRRHAKQSKLAASAKERWHIAMLLLCVCLLSPAGLFLERLFRKLIFF